MTDPNMPQTQQSLRDIFEAALLAKAAYAKLDTASSSTDIVSLAGLLNSVAPGNTSGHVLRAAAAWYVADRFGVVTGSHRPDVDPNGFSATLFARRATVGGTGLTMDYTYAIRGTNQLWEDVVKADVGEIALAGVATSQQAAMLDHFASLRDAHAFGESSVRVTGHSLGAHLTQLLTISSQRSRILHAYGFNTPGIRYQVSANPVADILVDKIFDEIARVVGKSTNRADSKASNFGFYPDSADTSTKPHTGRKECPCRSASVTALSTSGSSSSWSAGRSRAAGRWPWRSGSAQAS